MIKRQCDGIRGHLGGGRQGRGMGIAGHLWSKSSLMNFPQVSPSLQSPP